MQNGQPQLQAPGSGLPWHELVLSRIGFKLYQRTTSAQNALSLFQSETNRIISLVKPVERKKGELRVLIPRIYGIEDSSRYWSVFMTMEHLNIVIPGVMSIIQSLVDGQTCPKEVRIQDVKPHEQAGMEQITKLEENKIRYEKFIHSLPSLRTNCRHSHPWFGPLNPHGFHCLVGFHQMIHRRQIERILSWSSRGSAD
jgi:hypothetical protein